MKKILVVVIISFLMAFLPSLSCFATNGNSVQISVPTVSGYETVAENGRLKLCFDFENTQFYVADKTTGSIWRSTPENYESSRCGDLFKAEMSSALIVEYHNVTDNIDDKQNSFSSSVAKGDFSVEKIKSGVRTVYNFAELNLKIPLDLTLEDGSLSVSVSTQDIEYNRNKLIIRSISVLPYFAAGKFNENGYAFLPDGCGGISYFSGDRTDAKVYDKMVYGADIATDADESSHITAPVFGVCKNDYSVLAVVSSDAQDARVCCAGSGQDTEYTRAYAKFVTTAQVDFELAEQTAMTVYEEGKIKASRLAVDYYFLDEKNGGYSEMARKYREILFDSEKIKSALVEPTLYLDLYASVKKTRSIWGIKYNYNCVLTSQSDVEKICGTLKNDGVNSFTVRYSNFDKKDISGYIVNKISWNNALGENPAEWINQLKGQSITVYPAESGVKYYKKSLNPLHTLNVAARDVSDTVIEAKIGKIGNKTEANYVPNYQNLKNNLSKLSASIKKKSFGSIGFSDLGSTLYSDFGSKTSKRTDYSMLVSDFLSGCVKSGNSIMLENPNAYAATYANEIIHLPTSTYGQDLIDTSVPFLQIVYSGIVRYSGESFNLAENSDEAYLKMLETGSMPCFSWIGKKTALLTNTELEYLYSSNYNDWLKVAAEQYKAVEEVAKATENTPFISHEIVADKVYLSHYENGAAVAVNYTDSPKTLPNGAKVPARGYLILKEG